MVLEVNRQLLAHFQFADPGLTLTDINTIFDQVTSEVALP